MKTVFYFFVSILFVLIITFCASCSKNTTEPEVQPPMTSLDDINADSVFVLYNNAQDSFIKLRINSEIGLVKGIAMIDSIPSGQPPTDLNEDFIIADQFGQTELRFQGEQIFKNSWNFVPYSATYKMKTRVWLGSSYYYSVINLHNISRFGSNIGTELRIWYFDNRLNVMQEIDLSEIASPGFTIGSINKVIFYGENIVFIDIHNGWSMYPGPHELVAYDLNTGSFRKFAFSK